MKLFKSAAEYLAMIVVLSVSSAASFRSAQTPTPPAPAQPVHFKCDSDSIPGLSVMVDLDRDPLEQLRINIAKVLPPSTDTTPPQIKSVLYTGLTAPVETVKIPATQTSVQFSVIGSDDVGLKSFNLYIDGAFVSGGSGGTELLAANGSAFAVRWNAAMIRPGAHTFRLVLYDAVGNASADKIWSMVK